MWLEVRLFSLALKSSPIRRVEQSCITRCPLKASTRSLVDARQKHNNCFEIKKMTGGHILKIKKKNEFEMLVHYRVCHATRPNIYIYIHMHTYICMSYMRI